MSFLWRQDIMNLGSHFRVILYCPWPTLAPPPLFCNTASAEGGTYTAASGSIGATRWLRGAHHLPEYQLHADQIPPHVAQSAPCMSTGMPSGDSPHPAFHCGSSPGSTFISTRSSSASLMLSQCYPLWPQGGFFFFKITFFTHLP